MSTDTPFDNTTQKNIDSWLNGNYDQESKDGIKRMIQENPKEAMDAFYTHLDFGTGGLRGVLGIGTNRMNQYTVGFATQGLANYILKQTNTNEASVLIGYDSRNQSKNFSEIAAKIFLANNITVFMFNELKPVSLVSFGCRYKKCNAAIILTASHNPPEYNGYKVYWSDGAQVLPPHDEGIIEEVNKITKINQVKTVSDLNHPDFNTIDEEVDQLYLETINKLQHCQNDNQEQGSSLNIVYTPLHGAGVTMIPKALKSWGFSSVKLVQEQTEPNGDFPTCPNPNPEEESALQLGIELMLETNSDILLGTDPDCDRIGVVVMHNCKAVLLNGNETASICMYHICNALSQQGLLPENAGFVKTIVTSDLLNTIAQSHNKTCDDVLTGFKYIGQLIQKWETTPKGKKFIFGGEESYGYLLGSHARDKDAVIMAPLIAEIALQAKKRKKTLIDVLHEIYKKHGVFKETLLSITYQESKENKEKIGKIMQQIRTAPPKMFGSVEIVTIEDYNSSISTNLVTGKTSNLTLPKSNVLLYRLADDSKLVIRPSGTEPKIKLYCGVVKKEFHTVEDGIKTANLHMQTLIQDLKNYLT